MPKPFSIEEKAYIKKRLIEEARDSLSQFGVRKTTVDDLVKKVRIPKGTFYLLYPSKELLFFDVLCKFQDEVQAELISQIQLLNQPLQVDPLSELIFSMYKRVGDSFIIKLISNGELDFLMHKLSASSLESHFENDIINAEQLLEWVPGPSGKDVETFSAALRGIFLMLLHKKEVGDQVFDQALKVLIRGVVVQLFE